MLAVALGLLAGCGQREEQRAPTPAAGDAQLIATLGDSYTEGLPYPEPQYQQVAQRRLGPGHAFRNCGRGGERTDEIAERLDECSAGADVLIIQGGLNDIAEGRSTSDAAGDLLRMVRAGKAKGLEVLVADVPPWNDGSPDDDAAIADLNERIYALAEQESVTVLPFHDTLEDPENPGRMRAEWSAPDNDHPNQAGYAALGGIIRVE